MTGAPTDAALLAEWAASFEPGDTVRVRVVLPDIGWEVDDWSFEVSEPPAQPVITATVHGFDLDFPDVARRLRSFADRLAYYNLVD